MNHKLWTEPELQILRDNHEGLPFVEIALLIPGHCEGSIKAKAVELGLRKRRKISRGAAEWTAEEIAVLKLNHAVKTFEQLAEILTTHPIGAIKTKARDLGLHKRAARTAKKRDAPTRRKQTVPTPALGAYAPSTISAEPIAENAIAAHAKMGTYKDPKKPQDIELYLEIYKRVSPSGFVFSAFANWVKSCHQSFQQVTNLTRLSPDYKTRFREWMAGTR